MGENEELKDFDALAWSRKVRRKASKRNFKEDGTFDWEYWEKRKKEIEKWRENDYKDPEQFRYQ